MAKSVPDKHQTRSTITACIVAHNEGALIRRCLESIVGVVDEIHIVHDGPCLDDTLDICAEYTTHISVRLSIGEAEPHRAWMFAQVRTKWILQMDSDEYLSSKLKQNVRELCRHDEVDAYTFVWPYWDGTKYRTRQWPRKKSLFQTKRIQFLAFPHEEVRTTITVDTNFRLEHKPTYDNYTWRVFRKKWMGWAKIHAHYFQKDSKTLDRFPKSATHLLPHYYEHSKHPLLYAVPIALYHFAGSYLLGGWKEGVAGFTISLMTGGYYLLIFFYLSTHKYD